VVRRSARVERLRARAPRYLLWAFLALTSAVGVREIVSPPEPAAPAARPAEVDHAAESYAVEFARAYLAFDARRPQERERRLRGLVPDELAPDAGFLPRSGSRHVMWAEVAHVRESAAGGRIVVVAAQTDAEPSPVYLAVPVTRKSNGDLVLTAYPALVGPPAVARGELPDREEVDDREVAAVARRVVTNYLAGEPANLAADLLPQAEVSLPPAPLRVRGAAEIAWADGSESEAVLVTVEAADEAGASYTLTYELGIERRRGRPYVSFIETVPTSP
jgi:Conjugative transposon protein TcpC